MCNYKRRMGALLCVLLLLTVLMLSCSSDVPPLTSGDGKPNGSVSSNTTGENSSDNSVFEGLSVHYIDVGQGDCILICFPDQTTMLIDCGNGGESSAKVISLELEKRKIQTINYLVLTHPDVDHVGSVKQALKEIEVELVYHPDVAQEKQGFDDYFEALEFLKEKGADTKISVRGECIVKGECSLAFLSPRQRNLKGSSYAEFHLAEMPTERQINDLSPYVYLEYKGVRFLFTGDNSSQKEQKLINDYKSGAIERFLFNKEVTVNLESIDFLKVAHHGSDDSTCADFLALTRPKNAIISVGGNNIYGHPSTSTLVKLEVANENVNVLRTDVKGTISVMVNKQGIVNIQTSS